MESSKKGSKLFVAKLHYHYVYRVNTLICILFSIFHQISLKKKDISKLITLTNKETKKGRIVSIFDVKYMIICSSIYEIHITNIYPLNMRFFYLHLDQDKKQAQ